MEQPTTCGQGLAAHAPLPAALGQLLAATAEVLAAHLPVLDDADPTNAAERAAYVELVARHRQLADGLRSLADTMAGQVELPMGRHREVPMANAAMTRAFSAFVEAEEALERLLGTRLRDDREMRRAMSDYP